MDTKVFWLVVFVLIGLTGSVLTFAIRYKNQNENAGLGVAGWTVFLLVLWLLDGAKLLK